MAEKKVKSFDEALRAEAAKAARKVEKSPVASDPGPFCSLPRCPDVYNVFSGCGKLTLARWA